MITDDLILELLLCLMSEESAFKLQRVVLSNCSLSDSLVTQLFDFLSDHRSTLISLKLYNNITHIVQQSREIPLLLQGTSQLAKLLYSKTL